MPIKPIRSSNNDELIAHIKAGLEGYEEEYVPGSWEKFKAGKKKKKVNIIWLTVLSGSAAILLLGFGLFMYQNETNDKNINHTTVSALKNNKANNEPLDAESLLEEPQQVKTKAATEATGTRVLTDKDPLIADHLKASTVGSTMEQHEKNQVEVIEGVPTKRSQKVFL